ncbi:translesion error-prone DNA polymerase V subunit UmuC [Yersinia intermedia]|uniref:translesion error-prone DNA polymerase V subunit UmuC n=1 Tax=Yersinia intermedia TaxID=631 RepID=UPI00065CE6CE|nr:translesion error-prone DNA polymerase V subunit UmuC [Yersinia intermedia]CRY84144.1 mutagenesis and repair protein MucB [Yersinia intermedia]
MFAIIDVNSMYCSCEQAFRPDLADRAVLVVSNNDGAVVARNRLAKLAGVKMGEPLFKVTSLIKKHNIAVFSSNYTLYNSLSSRFVSVVESLSAECEQYSIDEIFINCTGINELDSFCRMLRDAVQKQTTLVCGVGAAKTKTLAKLCNHAAKTWPAYGGVVALTDPRRLAKLMSILPASEIWGIGRRISKSLSQMGINTALELAQADTRFIRKHFGVTVERTVRELRGEVCFKLEEHPATKQQIVVSRSFGQRITCRDEMQQAITGYAAKAAEKLRNERQYCRVISVFVRTSPYAVNDTQYGNQATEKLITSSQDTRDIIAAAQRALSRIWKDNIRYAKAGVMLGDFSGREAQLNLFDESSPRGGSDALMGLLDRINLEGKSQIFFAGQGINPVFKMKREMLSPEYTTNWNDIPSVRIK